MGLFHKCPEKTEWTNVGEWRQVAEYGPLVMKERTTVFHMHTCPGDLPWFGTSSYEWRILSNDYPQAGGRGRADSRLAAETWAALVKEMCR